jgi:hypothetical protein
MQTSNLSSRWKTVKVPFPTKAGERYMIRNVDPVYVEIRGREPFWLRQACKLDLVAVKNDLPPSIRPVDDPLVWVIRSMKDDANE